MNTILKKTIKKLNSKNVLITNTNDVYYLTRFKSSNLTVLHINENWYAVTDKRYLERAEKEITNMRVIDQADKGWLKKLMEDNNQDTLYLSKSDTTILSFEFYQNWGVENNINIESIDYGYIRNEYRDEDLELMKDSLAINERIFEETREQIKVGMTEKEVRSIILSKVSESEADDVSFDPIVASGKSGSNPHWTASDNVINANEILTIDMGVFYKGFASDMTRAFVVEGQLSEEEQKIWEVTKETLDGSIKAIKAGVTCKELHQLSLDIMDKHGYKEYFTHSLGHGLGVEIHDSPSLSINSKEVLEAGMVITIEPGIYIPGKYGVRLEETVLVTENGYEVLNNLEIKLNY